MTTYEDNLLASRFAALTPEPLPGDWADVLRRSGVARQKPRRLGRFGAFRGRRRWPLVALALVLLVGVLLVTPAFGRLLDLLQGEMPVGGGTPVWSPDGRRIVFVTNRDGNSELYAMRVDGSGQRRLTRSSALDFAPDWSPSGRRLAFMRVFKNADGDSGEIYVVRADGTGLRNLTRNAKHDYSPAWSPDGRTIAFGSFLTGNGEIYVMHADGSGLRNLTRNGAFDGGPLWLPDGRRIAFTRAPRFSMNPAGPDTRKSELWVMNADGSGQKRMTRNSMPEGVAVWSPDGRKIAFAGPGGVSVVNADGSGLRSLTRQPGDFWPVWSPDGRRIAFRSTRDGNAEIYVMNADGSGARNLTRNPANDDEPVWSPDARTIAFASGRDGSYEVYVMNADGSGQRRLT